MVAWAHPSPQPKRQLLRAKLHAGPNFVTRPDPEKPERDPTRPANFKKIFDTTRPDPQAYLVDFKVTELLNDSDCKSSSHYYFTYVTSLHSTVHIDHSHYDRTLFSITTERYSVFPHASPQRGQVSFFVPKLLPSDAL